MKTAEEIIIKIAKREDCYWDDMENLVNMPIRFAVEAMEEYANQFKPTAEANANTVLGVPLLLERKGCNCCGGKLVFIRGKYPKDEQREICPTCAYERLEEIHRISDADYGKPYCSDSNGT